VGKIVKAVTNAVKSVVKEVGRIGKQIVKFSAEVVKGLAKTVVALSRVDTMILHPDQYLKNLGVEVFKSIAEPLAVFTGRDFAYQAVYWGAMAAALVASFLIGPEIVAGVDAVMAMMMESVAAYVTNAALLTVVYYTMSAAAMVGSAYLTAYMEATLLNGIAEAYFTSMYGAGWMNEQLEMKRMQTNDFADSLMDGSVFDWLAGGVALNAVMAGGEISNPYAPNDPYTKGMMYSGDSNDILGGVMMAAPYSNLAGGGMFAFNAESTSPYNPMMINV